ncbi:MAG: DsbA family protein [Candidatus Micrarchaeia archaeon]
MVDIKRKAKKEAKKQEPVLLVKSTKFFGLDSLHILLIALVIILIALTISILSFKPGPTILNCPYGVSNNSTCITPKYTTNQVLLASEKVLASYSLINSSLSLIPYYSLVNESKVLYIPNQSEWLTIIPFKDPLAENKTFNLSILLNNNLSLKSVYIQSFNPLYSTSNHVSAFGVVSINGKTACNIVKPIPIYLIVDPYATGALNSIYKAINASNKYGNSINISYKFIFTGFAMKYYNSYGVAQTQLVGKSLFCASQQPKEFKAFISNYSIVFDGEPLSESILNQVAMGSGLNMSKYNACMLNSSAVLQNQALLANFYNITTTPTFVVNCKYETIPETLDNAINYALNMTKNS